MATIATDDFNRANGGLGANWTTPTGDTAINVFSNAARYSNQNADACAVRTAESYPNDQYAQMAITRGTDNFSEAGLGLCTRAATAAQTRYRLVISGNANPISFGKDVAGSYTLLTQRTTTWTNGDILRLESQGTTQRILRNGVQNGASVTDSSVTTGKPGIFYSSTDNSSSGDNWEGGDFTGGSTTIPNKAYITTQAVRRAAYW